MPTTPNQLLDQSVRHIVYLEGYKTGSVKEFSPFMEKMEKAIVSDLSGDITEWNRKRLNKQLKAVKDSMKAITVDIEDLMKLQVTELSSYEAGFEARSLGNVVEGYDFDIPSDTQLKAAVLSEPLSAVGPSQGQLLGEFFDDWSSKSIKRVSGAIRLGFASGKTMPQLVRDIGGVMDVSKRDLNNIVRTGLAHTANVARAETWNQNKSVIKRVRITATLDGKTSGICRSLDGQEYPLDKGPRPPFHVNCRTTTTAVLDKRYSFLSEGKTRSTRDPETGKIKSTSSKDTYYSWLKKQPAGVQDSIVGPTRGKLLRNGGISSGRFAELQLGKNFEPLTLKEMKELEPFAFEKANIEIK